MQQPYCTQHPYWRDASAPGKAVFELAVIDILLKRLSAAPRPRQVFVHRQIVHAVEAVHGLRGGCEDHRQFVPRGVGGERISVDFWCALHPAVV
jgi:hypothetical protein